MTLTSVRFYTKQNVLMTDRELLGLTDGWKIAFALRQGEVVKWRFFAS